MSKNNTQVMVTVRCLAYNHEPYIRQCLEGFVMQKTDFDFEVIVHDDASTDGTVAIIREYAEKYPNIIKPFFETENQYSKHNGVIGKIMRENTHGKYIALCEGDDYWIDPFKLQKQVDFLENHSDYGLVCTDVNFYFQSKDRYLNGYFQYKRYPIKYTFEDFLINGWFVAPCTWLYRSSFVAINRPCFMVGDLPLLLEISSRSKIKFLAEVTAVYRVLTSSSSHQTNFASAKKYYEGIRDIQYYYLSKKGDKRMKLKIDQRLNLQLLKLSIKYRNPLKILHYIFSFLFRRDRIRM